jgi:hypothetical protein
MEDYITGRPPTPAPRGDITDHLLAPAPWDDMPPWRRTGTFPVLRWFLALLTVSLVALLGWLLALLVVALIVALFVAVRWLLLGLIVSVTV